MSERECVRCHRVGCRAFAPAGDYGWLCVNERACDRRVVTRTSRLVKDRTGSPLPAAVRRRAVKIMAAAATGRTPR